MVTYGFPHHPTSRVDMPEVESAMPARPIRAEVGRDDSTMNIKGDRAADRPNDDRENILRRRKVGVRGPLYSSADMSSADRAGLVSTLASGLGIIEYLRPNNFCFCVMVDGVNRFEFDKFESLWAKMKDREGPCCLIEGMQAGRRRMPRGKVLSMARELEMKEVLSLDSIQSFAHAVSTRVGLTRPDCSPFLVFGGRVDSAQCGVTRGCHRDPILDHVHSTSTFMV